MDTFTIDSERLAWLLETDAQLELDFDCLAAEAGASEAKAESGNGEKDSGGKDSGNKDSDGNDKDSEGKSSSEAPGELPPDKRPKYITNYIGSKQKLVDWIWKNTPDSAKSVADAAYFDPPYATEFSTTNYEKSYHFVEGLMSYWKGIELRKDTKTKHYDTDHVTVTKANASDFFETFLASAKHISHWLISTAYATLGLQV